MDDGSTSAIAAALIAFAAGLIFIAGCALYYGRRIAAPRIPMQWGSNGEPTWFAPRLIGIWFAFGFTAIVSAVLLALAHHEPQKLTSLIVAMAIVIGTNMWMQVFHLKRVIRWEQSGPGNEPRLRST